MQFELSIPCGPPFGDSVEWCAETLTGASRVSQYEVELVDGDISVWNEPDDGAGELHVALRRSSRSSLAGLGALLVSLTERFGEVSWKLDD